MSTESRVISMSKPRKSQRRCEVCGMSRTTQNNVFLARFPQDPDRCRAWVKAVGNEDLAYLPIRKLHELKFVCGNHFSRRDFTRRGARLKRTSVPTVKLKNPPITDELLEEFPLTERVHLIKIFNTAKNHNSFETGDGGGGETGGEKLVSTKSIDHDHSYYRTIPYELEDEYEQPTVKRHYDHTYCRDEIPPSKIARSTGRDIPFPESIHFLLRDHIYSLDARLAGTTIKKPKSVVVRNVSNSGTTSKNQQRETVIDQKKTEASQSTISTSLPLQQNVDCDETGDDSAMDMPDDTISESENETFSWENREVIPVLTEEVVEEPTQPLLDTICEEDTELYGQCESTQETQPKSGTEDVQHIGFQCNVCGADIKGFRYVCVQCSDFDLCDACEGRGEHAQHYVLRVPEARPYNEIQMVLRSIRRELDVILQRSWNTLDETAPDDVKSEIKEEYPDSFDESVSFVPDAGETMNVETPQSDNVCSAACVDDTLPGECRVAVDETTSARMKHRGEPRRAPTRASDGRGRLRKRKHVDVGENQSETEDFSEFEDDDYSPEDDDSDDDSDGSSDRGSNLDHNYVRMKSKNSVLKTLSNKRLKLVEESGDKDKSNDSEQCDNLKKIRVFKGGISGSSASQSINLRSVTRIRVGNNVLRILKLKKPFIRTEKGSIVEP